MAKDDMKKLRQVLYEINEAPVTASGQDLEDIIRRAGVCLPTPGMDSLKDKCIRAVHTHLQTQIMVEACNFAKWSCICAAIAAFSSAVSAIAAVVIIIAN